MALVKVEMKDGTERVFENSNAHTDAQNNIIVSWSKENATAINTIMVMIAAGLWKELRTESFRDK